MAPSNRDVLVLQNPLLVLLNCANLQCKYCNKIQEKQCESMRDNEIRSSSIHNPCAVTPLQRAASISASVSVISRDHGIFVSVFVRRTVVVCTCAIQWNSIPVSILILLANERKEKTEGKKVD